MLVLKRRSQVVRTVDTYADAVPSWLAYLFSSAAHKKVLLSEWEDEAWRSANGWKGSDLIHNRQSKAVRIMHYFWDKESEELTGIANFGAWAESGRGYCHGGAMTSVLDDVLGHTCFCASSGPWDGATVQVNAKLLRPIAVGSTLKVTGKVVKRVGRPGSAKVKFFISGTIEGPEGLVYAELDGVSVSGISLEKASARKRTWVEADRTLGHD